LAIYHQLNDDTWEQLLPTALDTDANIITVQTDCLSPFALGAVPEPSSLALLGLGGLALLRRRRAGGMVRCTCKSPV